MTLVEEERADILRRIDPGSSGGGGGGGKDPEPTPGGNLGLGQALGPSSQAPAEVAACTALVTGGGGGGGALVSIPSEPTTVISAGYNDCVTAAVTTASHGLHYGVTVDGAGKTDFQPTHFKLRLM